MSLLKVFLTVGSLFFSFTSFANTSFAKKYPSLKKYYNVTSLDDHICNEILEFANEKIVPGRKRFSNKWYDNSLLATEAVVFYGKCLILNSTDLVEQNRGISILQDMIKNETSIPSRYFLARTNEAKMEPEDMIEREISQLIIAYANTSNIIQNSEMVTLLHWSYRLANTFVFLMNYKRFLNFSYEAEKIVTGMDIFYLEPLYNKIPDLFPPNNYRHEWWISLYKVPQLHLFRFINHLQNQEFDEESLDYTIEYAEECMSFFDSNPRFVIPTIEKLMSKEFTELNISIYRACEGLKEIALDFIDRGESLSFDEISHILESQKKKEQRLLDVVAKVSSPIVCNEFEKRYVLNFKSTSSPEVESTSVEELMGNNFLRQPIIPPSTIIMRKRLKNSSIFLLKDQDLCPSP